MSKIKRKTGSDFGSEGLGREETKGQNRGARSRYAEEMPERARRWISPMGMPAIDVRELSDEMLIFMLQLMAPEKYGSPDPQGGDAESHRSSVSSDQSLAGKKAGGGRSEMPGEAPARGKTEYGMRKTGGNDQSSVISDRAAAGESMALATDAGSAGVRSELPGSSELPELGGDFTPQTAGGKSLMPQDCPEFSGSRMGFASRNCRWRKSAAADPIHCANRTGFCHPFRVQDFLTTIFQGCRCAPRPGYSNGIPPGCAYTGASEIPETECNFSSQGAAGEWLMRYKCPEIQGGGVKAVEGSRSPSPGGTMDRLETDEHSWGRCRGVNEADDWWRLPPWRRLPNLRGVRRRKKVRLGTGAVRHVASLPTRPVLRSNTAEGGQSATPQVRQPAPHLAERRNCGDRWFPDACVRPRERWSGIREIPELSLEFSAETADGEKVTNVEKPICPPVARRNEGVATRDRRGREPAATDACHALTGLGNGWGWLTWACARRTRFSPGYHMRGLLDMNTLAEKSAPQRERSGDVAPLGLEDVCWGWVSINMPALWASELRPARAVPGQGGRHIYSGTTMGMLASLELLESWWDFDWQGIGGEKLMRLECPEFRRGRGPVNLISRRALRSFAGKTSELEPMNLPQRNAASTKINNAAVSGQQGDAAGNTESAESPCGFDLEVVVFHYANGVPLTEGADALKVIFTIDLAPSF